MVRFHWHVEAGHSSFVPPGGVTLDKESGVRFVMCEMELAGQNETCTSMLTVPSGYLDASNIRPVGIVLGHGADADEWRGRFLTRIAVHFAKKGYVVMRYYCKQKEQRRQRIYEKALDTAATSPFARSVQSWVLAGFDNGARIAAQVGSKCRGSISGFILLSYPLLDPCPPPPKQKVGAIPPPDSKGPLLKLSKPMLFINGEFDAMCPGADLRDIAREMVDVDMRAVVLPDLDGAFLTATERETVGEPATEAILEHMQTFLSALEAPGGLAACPLARAADLEPSTREPPSPMRRAAEETRAKAAEVAAAAAEAAAAAQAQAAAAAAAAQAGRLPGGGPAGVGLRGAPAPRATLPGGFAGAGGLLARPPAGLQMRPALVNNPAALQQLQFLMMQQQAAALLMQQQQQQQAVRAPAPAPGPASLPQQSFLQGGAMPQQQLQQPPMAALPPPQQQFVGVPLGPTAAMDVDMPRADPAAPH